MMPNKDYLDNKKDFIVVVERVSKYFKRNFIKNENFLFRILLFRFWRSNNRKFNALNEVSFKLKSGMNLGIIGKNGSGKSTLLRLIAGIYTPDKGNINHFGSIVYLTSFNQGLSKKLTMRDNIYLVGSLMGLNKKEVDKKFEEIVEFSGLKEFIDAKVFQFSGGMINRLNFSIIIHCIKHRNPDILLIDEAIEVGGDINFQKKALDKMEELINSGASVIFISHNLDYIQKYCDRVIWLDNGKIVMSGNPRKIIKAYIRKNLSEKDVKKYLRRMRNR